jgi:hypothetical protein
VLRGRETDAAIAAGNECNFSFQLAHIFLLIIVILLRIFLRPIFAG